MAFTPTMLGFVPVTAADPAGTGVWDVNAEVDDPSERFSGFDVALGDVVFLDFIASTTAPGTVGRYEVDGVVSRSTGLVRVLLRWGGVGTPVSPLESAGHRGYLAKPSPRNGLAWHPSSRTLLVEPRLIEAAKNVEMFAVVDNFDSAAAPSPDSEARARQVRSVPTPLIFSYGQVVTTRPGVGALANPRDTSFMPGIGLALGMGDGVVYVQTSGTFDNLPYTLIPGERVWVGENGSLTQDPANVPRPGELQLLGVAVDATSVTISPPGLVVRRG